MSDFPAVLTDAVDTTTDIVAKHLNNLEAKVGIDGSAVVTSLDYLLKNAASIDPGHKHTPAKGGTGIYSYTIGDMLYASGATTLAALAAVAVNNVLISGGVATAPSWGKVGLTTHISGILPVANGGTGASDGWTAAQDPGHKHSKLWASDGSPQAVTVDATGNVTLAGRLDVYGVSRFCDRGAFPTAGAGIEFYYEVGTAIGSIYVYDRGALVARDLIIGGAGNAVKIKADGKVGIATMSPGYLLACNGEPGANGYTAWTNYSDIRFKQNIIPLNNNILSKVLKLNPVTFFYNDKNPWGEKPGERLFYGLIAQELQELFPDMVGEAEGPDGEKYLTTNLSNLTLYLVQAIKEQQAYIADLQAYLN